MHATIPLSLNRLHAAAADAERDDAWREFVAAHSDLMLRTCRRVAHDYDAAMDAYAFVLQSLREDNCRRLRAYVPDGRTQFTTWLVVVTRRLVLDHLRRRYGRPRSEHETRRLEHSSRRRLEDLLADEIEPDQLPGSSRNDPDSGIRRQQLASALREAFNELRPDERLLITLRFADERPVREIARVMRLPSVFHVYRRVNVVLERLRAALARRGIDAPEP